MVAPRPLVRASASASECCEADRLRSTKAKTPPPEASTRDDACSSGTAIGLGLLDGDFGVQAAAATAAAAADNSSSSFCRWPLIPTPSWWLPTPFPFPLPRAREVDDDGCPSRLSSIGWRFDLDEEPRFEEPRVALARAFAIALLLPSETWKHPNEA